MDVSDFHKLDPLQKILLVISAVVGIALLLPYFGMTFSTSDSGQVRPLGKRVGSGSPTISRRVELGSDREATQDQLQERAAGKKLSEIEQLLGE